MTATLATAAVLLVPFLGVVLVGALAVAIHDAVERAWAARRSGAGTEVVAGAANFVPAPRRLGRRDGTARRVRSAPAPAPQRPGRRAPVVVAR